MPGPKVMAPAVHRLRPDTARNLSGNWSDGSYTRKIYPQNNKLSASKELSVCTHCNIVQANLAFHENKAVKETSVQTLIL